MTYDAKHTCFVASPIGSEGSEPRRKADWLLIEIIKKALEPLNFKVIRADEINDPGQITAQVIEWVLTADLVVADLTDHNPNAFYELALRHREKKPIIHMAVEGTTAPFDIKDYRYISYSLSHPSDLEKARERLAAQAQAVLAPGFVVSNPVTQAMGVMELKGSGDPKDVVIAKLSADMDDAKAEMAATQRRIAVLERGLLLALRSPQERLADALSRQGDPSALTSAGLYGLARDGKSPEDSAVSALHRVVARTAEGQTPLALREGDEKK